MTERKLRVGVIGAGRYAVVAHIPQLRATGRAEVVAISRRNRLALAQAGAAAGVACTHTDWRALLDRPDLDAVVIATASHAHAAPALAALERGLHVLVEKPLTLRGDEAWALVRAAAAAGRVLQVGYQSRCRGDMRAAHRAVAGGALGRVRQVAVQWSFDFRLLWDAQELGRLRFRELGVPAFEADWARDGYWRKRPATAGGGQFADLGSHAVDLALWLGGAPPVLVSGFTEAAGYPLDTFVVAQARLANDVLVSLASADVVPGRGGARLSVLGEAGSLAAEWWGGMGGPVRELWRESGHGRERLAVDEADATVAAAFVASVLDGAPNPAPARDGAYAVAFTEAVYRAAAEGRAVEIAYPAGPPGTP